MTTDDFNSLVAEVQGLTSKVNSLVDSVASLDLKYVRTKYLSQLTDVSITYPSEDDVLVYDTSGVWKNAQLSSIGSSSNGTNAQSIYIIGRDDDTDPTYTNVYSAARTLTDFVSSVNDDYVYGNLTFYNENTSTASKIYVDEITSRNYNQNTVLGSGFIYMINSAGNSYIEVDELAVRQSMVVNSMKIKEINSVGGALIISPASETITRVEETTQIYNSSYQTVWRCYFTSTNVSTEQTISTNFVAGDLARIQTYNVTNTGVYENSSNSYYWGLVLGVGDGYIDLSQTDVDSTSTITTPSAGDTVVQFGNISNTARQNVIMLDTYGTGNPSISMYQGISSYDLTDKVMIQMAYDETEEQAYFTVYGRTYFGTKDETTSYVKYNPQTNLVTIKADIRIVGEEDGDDTLISGGYINTKYIDAETIVANIGVIHNELQVGDNFTVDAEGNLTASNATISGTINATSGTITGVTVTDLLVTGTLHDEGNNFVLSSYYISYTTEAYYVLIGKGSLTAGGSYPPLMITRTTAYSAYDVTDTLYRPMIYLNHSAYYSYTQGSMNTGYPCAISSQKATILSDYAIQSVGVKLINFTSSSSNTWTWLNDFTCQTIMLHPESGATSCRLAIGNTDYLNAVLCNQYDVDSSAPIALKYTFINIGHEHCYLIFTGYSVSGGTIGYDSYAGSVKFMDENNSMATEYTIAPGWSATFIFTPEDVDGSNTEFTNFWKAYRIAHNNS